MAPLLESPREIELDPREREPWFQQLPAVEQARLRQRWDEHASRDQRHVARDRRLLLRAMGECAGIFAVVLLLTLSWRQAVTWHNLLLVPVAGAAAGFLVHNWLRDQFGVTLVGLIGVFLLAWLANPYPIQLVLAIAAGGVAFGCYGVRRHFRAMDGMQ